MKPEEFDKRFLAALEAETRKTVAGFEEWQKRLKRTGRDGPSRPKARGQ